MNAPVIRKVALSVGFQPLAATRTVGDFYLRAPSSGAAVLLGDDGVTEVPLDRSLQFTLTGVDLAQIRVKSNNIGDEFIVIGTTRIL